MCRPMRGAPWLALLLLLCPAALAQQRGYLGVQVDQQYEGKGVRIAQVIPGTAAAQAGLQAGDVLVAAGGQTIDGFQGLVYKLRELRAGSKLALRVSRGAQTLDLVATLGAAPPPVRSASGRARVPAGARPDLGLLLERGRPVIATVRPGGPAARVGLLAGDQVIELDWQAVADRAGLARGLAALRPYSTAVLAVRRGAALLVFTIDVAFTVEPGAEQAAAALARLPRTAPERIDWGHDLERGLEQARKLGRNVMVEVWGKG